MSRSRAPPSASSSGGKSGKLHDVGVRDRRLARIIERCQDLPGYELFHYVDEQGEPRPIDAADVNDYLRAISGEDFTARDFRTWAGTVLASLALRELEAFTSETQAKRNVVAAIKAVAQRLGNTPAVCRKCYVHPAVLDCYLAGNLQSKFVRCVQEKVESAGTTLLEEVDEEALREEEKALMPLLRGIAGEKHAAWQRFSYQLSSHQLPAGCPIICRTRQMWDSTHRASICQLPAGCPIICRSWQMWDSPHPPLPDGRLSL